MRADLQLERVPVIIISNLGQDSDVARGQSLGAVAYFVKAKVSIDELVEEVRKYLLSDVS
jgi:DNA-binding response OmpR family regulator